MSEVGGPGRRVVLCADDYAMNVGVSEGILALAEAGRISATSCMANAPGWRAGASALLPLRGRIGIGMHLSLTWGAALGPMPSLAPSGAFLPLGEIMRRSFMRKVPPAEIEAEIERQLDAFTEALGHPPDFVDGHQHVHVLPVVRSALLAVLSRRGLAGKLWLRDSGDRIPAIMARRIAGPKALLVHGLAQGFRSAATRAGFATNVGFSGFSPFDPSRPVGSDVERYLMALGPAPLVMCHPGRADAGDADDEIAAARHAEFAYLSSDAFADLLRRKTLSLTPWPA